MTDVTAKHFDEMEAALGGVPGEPYAAPLFTELGAGDRPPGR